MAKFDALIAQQELLQTAAEYISVSHADLARGMANFVIANFIILTLYVIFTILGFVFCCGSKRSTNATKSTKEAPASAKKTPASAMKSKTPVKTINDVEEEEMSPNSSMYDFRTPFVRGSSKVE